MQRPPQTIVCVQIEPLGQSFAPTTQGFRDVGVAMHWPPQDVEVGGQNTVGVQVEPVGQGPLLPTVQGITGGITCVAKHKPPHVSVCVQIEPVGQGFPNVQVTENTGGVVVEDQPRASGIVANTSASFILTKD
jgi:hypothetical protein